MLYLYSVYKMFQQLHNGAGYIPEMEQIISQLERGTLVTKFSWRKKPESKTLAIRRETRQLIWTRTSTNISRTSYEGTIDLAEIKEVRLGKNSKDFEKWPDEARSKDVKKCFVIFYGTEFKLRVLSIAALSEEEKKLWVKGLNYLIKDTINASYPLQVQSWLRREFYKMGGDREMVSLRDIKTFLSRVNYKIPTNKLREVFNEVDIRRRTEIGFDDFTILYQKLILEENTIGDIFPKMQQYSSNLSIVSLHDLQRFFKEEQNDPIGGSKELVRNFICDFLRDPQRDIQEPYFTITEFLDFLFSKQNDLWDLKKNKVYQDMTRPLSHYWIASSHNTYLTGDQFSSESSVEAYARCLRMGCRCIELDCWDGPCCTPYIYHGHTLTTKIRFIDVIRTIKEHAFATSEYPVILSIEDNCSLPQQREMANNLQDVFGDMLLVRPYDRNENELPSPYNLRHKIILKHKKLPEGQEDCSSLISRTDSTDTMDLRNAVKSGVMYLEDPVDKEWSPHFFVLNNYKLFYTSHYPHDGDASERDDDEDDASSFSRPNGNIPNEELHFSEKWFHGRLANRDEAEKLLKAYAHLGDGTFLVRPSFTFVGEYCLSFLANGQVNHCRIKSKEVKQQTRYYLNEARFFDSLYSLITQYRTTPVVAPDFSITLQEPVPEPNLHENEEWYHKNTTKQQAEEVLKRIKTEGAFLVRPSENDVNCYTISFRADRKIKHCRIKLEGRLYTIGSVEFESLVDLINYYENHPLYRRVPLSHPVKEESVQLLSVVSVVMLILHVL
ncbi:hypothetical protein GWI33_017246 [Rhynchophorus ferrugineus]|uniref:Phosphoinositide phospholipase C n=1 Tax=Rhynchophorus ferrugineus TaxID=354439 RepID=A0A834M456_RHYFE|nr:hypothetical protein GWI33_017246 [Rhynchophorus ferrugineus]